MHASCVQVIAAVDWDLTSIFRALGTPNVVCCAPSIVLVTGIIVDKYLFLSANCAAVSFTIYWIYILFHMATRATCELDAGIVLVRHLCGVQQQNPYRMGDNVCTHHDDHSTRSLFARYFLLYRDGSAT